MIVLTQTYLYIYTASAFVAGFIIAWIIRTISMAKIMKLKKSTEGYLESEKLMKETLQKENVMVHQMKESVVQELTKKLKESQDLNRILDENILLLQKSNEETEALLKAGMPALHDLKLKLIEAQNTIARIKAQGELKETNF
ncbi:MAG: hypothetical protein JWP81_3062 [Ferruginibacter sp.]|nr:hypothetical protein [Ferruginibacter sp.]